MPLVRVDARTAAEVCGRVYLDKEALRLLEPSLDPRQFIQALVDKKQYLAAIDFIAHALSARDAIWWGCLCLQHLSGGKLEGWDKAACRAAVRWVYQPNEANRAAARQPADALGPGCPAGGLAAAVYQTGPSLPPPDGPPIQPGPFAPARAVAIAVKVASTKGEPEKILITQASFIDLGIAIAEGQFRPRKD